MQAQPKQKDVHRRTGGLETATITKTMLNIVHRRTGGLEIY